MNLTKFLKKLLLNASLAIFSLLLVLGGFEGLLRAGLFDGEDDPRPVWIPPKFKQVATVPPFYGENFFSFNDIIRSPEKRQNFKRIVILGDSFVYGQGLPYEKGWTHRLEKQLAEEGKNIEVLSFGIGGWSTWVEKWFFENYLKDYQPDLVVVGYCTNDPDFLNIERKEFVWHRSSSVAYAKKGFPLVTDFSIAYINRFLSLYFYPDYGYAPWLENLYSQSNMTAYEHLIRQFKGICDARKIPLLFVLTPSDTEQKTKDYLEKVSNILERQQVEHFNLFPAVYEQFKETNPRALWAHPGDGHPGEQLSELYSNEVYKYLKTSGRLEMPAASEPITFRENPSLSPNLSHIKDQTPVPSVVLTDVNQYKITESEAVFQIDTTEYRSSRYLYLKGKTDELSSPNKYKVYITVDDEKIFPTYYGPTYYRRPVRTNHIWNPRSETMTEFKIHIPLEEIGTGYHKIDVLLFSPSGEIRGRSFQSLMIDIQGNKNS